MIHRKCLYSDRRISHFRSCRHSSFSFGFVYFRYHASLLLKRMNAQEQGQYTFFARSDLANASITFQVQMYRK